MDSKITVGGVLLSSINFAMQQNYVPVIRDVTVNNDSDRVLENVTLKITFEPNFAKEFSYNIQSIAPHSSVEINPVNIRLSTDFLFSLTEKLVGEVQFTLYENDAVVFQCDKTIELLAYDQWGGVLLIPEIIAAFVTPNHPKISEVISAASGYLKQWGKYPSFTGYQTRNPDNVKAQMAAIYAALQSAGIIYNSPPASYETVGQRIRLPHIVLQQKHGTCLDLAVLYASCLEAVGLHPIIVIIKGHAFCGCWLEEETFADCAVDDVAALQKRTVAGSENILLAECTDFCAGKGINFEKALKHGKDNLLNEDEFCYAIDIQRSRGSGIRPIPLQIKKDFAAQAGQENLDTAENISAPQELKRTDVGVINCDQKLLTRQQIWERKLLDFSLRNSLLNFRGTKNSIQFMVSDIALLEDELAAGTSFRIMEVPSEWTASVRDVKLYEIENDNDLISNIAQQEFKNNRLRTFLSAEELEKSLKTVYRSAKSGIEENGSNTLFAALGFLKWFESDLSEKPRYAPLILVPIELLKSSKNKGYVIKSRQEETQINITLIEYLRQIFELKIPSLDPLPEDESGIDIPLVFNTIRNAILDKKRWNIVDAACIGQFSFGQFVMWSDLHNRAEELKENKVVASLIDQKISWEPKQMELTPEELDSTVAPDQMAIPLSADSSQMLAITAAANGESFVLHGPPGTGKSQTITNMIANALYHGKSVLFVAEKMAALNVVQNRLAAIGLDPFCLELHSNKSSKSSVLSQLNNALEVGRIKQPDEYRATAQKLNEIRTSMNDVINGLHQVRQSGYSVYEAIEHYEQYSDFKDKLKISAELVHDINKEKITELEKMVDNYAHSLDAVGDTANHPLRCVLLTEYSIEARQNIYDLSSELINNYKSTSDSLTLILNSLNLPKSTNRAEIENVLQLCKALLIQAPLLGNLIARNDYSAFTTQVNSFYNDGLAYEKEKQEIAGVFTANVFSYDFTTAFENWKSAENMWFLSKNSKQKKLLNELKMYSLNPESITKENIVSHYNKLCAFKMLKNKLDSSNSYFSNPLSGWTRGSETDWNMLRAALNKAEAVHKVIQHMKKLPQIGTVLTAAQGVNYTALSNGVNTVESYLGQWDKFTRLCKINKEQENNEDWFNTLEKQLCDINSNTNMLFDWTAYTSALQALKENGLECIHTAVENNQLNSKEIQPAFECQLFYMLVLNGITQDNSLKMFRSDSFENTIEAYHKLIDDYSTLTVQELVAKLSADVPVSGAVSSSSEMGILKRAIKSNGRMMSIRKLFNSVPSLLRRLCPCMLMSPISVAQYIDPKFPKFDLVIFDEASQLPTCEAVGTIARGENVVVVGDPKQLPPTGFFKSNRIDEENIENEDLESLLDDCLSISMPQMYLKWHYRSRHESLIAFSNMQYYDNKLYTFPSPNDRVSAVSLVHIDGFYDKGNTKENRAEAQAVVAEIMRRLSDENLRNSSIGVVTFNVIQQHLIEDLLAEAFAENPELEKYDLQSYEPVFVKNLENVQGDERDVILFSVGYGPDKNGKVSMNFGPLNREGGWRRLNVAISRARKEMIVYATITPEQIDTSRTRAEGVAGLKGFLKFAQQNKNIVIAGSEDSSVKESTITADIAAAIEKLGYKVNTNIGCSKYKIDIGVIDPNNPDTYILGILTDGVNCKSSATAKDRFVLQPDILGGLGWSVMHVWTLEWFDNPQRVIEKIKQKIDFALTAEKDENSLPKTVPASNTCFEKIDTEALQSPSAKSYVEYKIESFGDIDSFYEPASAVELQKLMFKIIMTESPISKRLLFKKVLSAYGISRSGSKTEEYLSTILAKIEHTETADGENIFCWSPVQEPTEYKIYRTAGSEGLKRNIDDISSYEILNAATEVLNQQGSIGKDDLIKETANRLGFARIGSLITATVNNAVELGLKNGTFNQNDLGKITAFGVK